MSRTAIIIGAGPAGLTAAYELLTRTDIVPAIHEQEDQVGGLAKTVNFHGNRMDIGGHRFFSKSDRVNEWWLGMLPLARSSNLVEKQLLQYHGKTRAVAPASDAPDPAVTDNVMLTCPRRSRIYFDGKFFDYPLRLSPKMLKDLGVGRAARIGISYLRRAIFPIRDVLTLEDFFINRFGDELYHTFFKEYTEKVWGVPCTAISPAWGAQRIKEVSVAKALKHWMNTLFRLGHKSVPTSMVEKFMYPKFGPGQMWEEAARKITAVGGSVHMNSKLHCVSFNGSRITGMSFEDIKSGDVTSSEGDFYLSSAPVDELIAAFGNAAPPDVREAAAQLPYRNFLAVGMLLRKSPGSSFAGENALNDSWLYIQDPSVKLGRLQIYNNWSPYMLHDPENVWLGLEYFCNREDALWNMSDTKLLEYAAHELERINIAPARDMIDGVVLRVEKAYPAYIKGYEKFPVVRSFLDRIDNLYVIGRNGMHKYNNQDHSMLTAMAAVDNIATGSAERENIWDVNSEEEYLEEMMINAPEQPE